MHAEKSKQRDEMAINSHIGYYRNEFNRIYDTNEEYKGKWNWASFFWGPIWAATKGLWVQAVVSFLVTLGTGGAVAPFVWIWYGMRGNYMFYSKAINGETKFF